MPGTRAGSPPGPGRTACPRRTARSSSRGGRQGVGGAGSQGGTQKQGRQPGRDAGVGAGPAAGAHAAPSARTGTVLLLPTAQRYRRRLPPHLRALGVVGLAVHTDALGAGLARVARRVPARRGAVVGHACLRWQGHARGRESGPRHPAGWVGAGSSWLHWAKLWTQRQLPCADSCRHRRQLVAAAAVVPPQAAARPDLHVPALTSGCAASGRAGGRGV